MGRSGIHSFVLGHILCMAPANGRSGGRAVGLSVRSFANFSLHEFPRLSVQNIMSAAIATKPKAGVEEADAPQVHRIRITLTSRNVAALEKTCSDLLMGARSKSLTAKGPIRMPTKTLRITTRKTPNGEGSKTWDRFEMRIHKRLIDLKAPTDVVKSITSISIEPGVDVEVSIVDV